jgi:hypothetical protein
MKHTFDTFEEASKFCAKYKYWDLYFDGTKWQVEVFDKKPNG